MKKMPSSARRAQLVRDPVALVAHGLGAEVLGELDGVVLDVEAGVERADADPQLVARGEAPAVAGGHDRAVDPDRQVVRRAVRVDLEAAGERGVGRLVAGRRRPASRRQPSASTISGADRSPRSVWTMWPVRPLTLAVSNCASPWAASSAHSSPVVERRERPRERPAGRAVRGADHELAEGLAVRAHQVEGLEPACRDAAGRGLALADLVAVDHQYPRRRAVRAQRAGELAGDREAREARPADQDVVVAVERGALVAALRLPYRHRHRRVPAFGQAAGSARCAACCVTRRGATLSGRSQ